MTRSRLGVAALLVAALCAALAACGTDDATPTAVSSVAPSCPAPATTTAPGAVQTITTPTGARSFNVWLPTGYTGAAAVPLVVDFHGLGEQSFDYATKVSGIVREAPGRGYLVVAPQGGVPGTFPQWSYPGYGTANDEVAFTTQMIATLASEYCIDPKRVYATGISQGAGLATHLGCQVPTYAAVAPLAGVSLVVPCSAAPPVPALAFHGTDDPTVPFEGDTNIKATPLPNEAYLGDVQAVMAAWAVRNGCAATFIDTELAPKTVRRSYDACPPGKEVALVISKGTGHTYPGGPAIPAADAAEAGGQSQAINASSQILDFFDAHRLA